MDWFIGLYLIMKHNLSYVCLFHICLFSLFYTNALKYVIENLLFNVDFSKKEQVWFNLRDSTWKNPKIYCAI